MLNQLQALRQHFSKRPDSEHQQAIVRLIIAVLILIYLSILASTGTDGDSIVRSSLLVMICEAAVGLALVVSIANDLEISPTRRLIGMAADNVTLAALMSLGGSALAPFYIIVMWVTIGNGLRYGKQYLFASMTFAVATFLPVIQLTPYWQDNQPLAWGLLLGLVAIPAYLMSLLNALTEARDKARRADAAKTRFLATMSHEFRTPLNGIVSASELLAVSDLSRDQRENTEILQASAQSLLALVEDVLDIAKIESGKLRQVSADFSLSSLLRSVEVVLRAQADKRQLAFTVEIDRDIPDQLHGDENHLRQIVMNLASNAIKFTEQGSVEIAVTCVGEPTSSDGEVSLHFEVRDTGIGIPLAAQPRIFDAFEQAEQGRARRYGGTGLGTTIAKSLTEMLGGTIGFTSTEGEGSQFWFALKMKVAKQVATADVENVEAAPLSAVISAAERFASRGNPAADAPAKIVAIDDPFFRHRALGLGAMKILIADDQPANIAILCRVLEKAGHRFHQVSSGEEVLAALEHSHYDCAIIDLHMPGCSGFDAIRQARVMEAGGRRTPFVVLTADATTEAVRECEVAGARAFLTKPIVVARLLDTLRDIARENAADRRDTLAAARSGSAIELVSLSGLRELAQLGLGDDFLRLFINECQLDATRCLNNMERLFTDGDWEGVSEHCHALKGVAANMAASRLAADATTLMNLEITQLGREGRQRIKSLQWCLESTRIALIEAMPTLTYADDSAGSRRA